DGLTFGEPVTLINGGAGLVTAPHLTPLDDQYIAIAFAWSESGETAGHQTVQEWVFRAPGRAPKTLPPLPSPGMCQSNLPTPPTQPPHADQQDREALAHQFP